MLSTITPPTPHRNVDMMVKYFFFTSCRRSRNVEIRGAGGGGGHPKNMKLSFDHCCDLRIHDHAREPNIQKKTRLGIRGFLLLVF